MDLLPVNYLNVSQTCWCCLLSKPPVAAHSRNSLHSGKKYDLHSYILCKEIFFYLFEIEVLLFLSSTPSSFTEEFCEFGLVFVLATATLSIVNFDRISYPSALQIEESKTF